MATYSEKRAVETGLAIEISAAAHHVMQAVYDYLAYRATVRELSELDRAALADLGIHRSGIRAAARKAVYGE
ncbi:DUF1127 domain-containing protein [Roseovarius indicus]|uniref:YjiS-like domain-containing protein n=1 Tax=Roseovarius indicus TaxID=540747 RepID=A0A0T5P895_9RHOB|nr:DUF1127 domain-containing protein [Roseovarius indicus]KRS17277.1 hypothetical protein XM52_14570 [Roseovarius indicus]QEW27677.1 hypothetical protein RIdsm_03494 [Roseovarius indicus]SFE33314.1 protein of unknown function [Roseovarius indicus]